MNRAEKEQLFQERVRSFYAALANVFMEEKDRIEVPQIKLKRGDDFNEVVAAMMGAEMAIFKQLASDPTFDYADMDMVGFTHMLNRIAIQHFFMQDDEPEDESDDDDDRPTLTMMKDEHAADEESSRRADTCYD